MRLSTQGINVAQTEAERNAIYEFRYQVYIEEMGKPYTQADHERRRLSDPLDEKATLLYSTRGGKIVSTIRINWGEDVRAFGTFAKSCNLAMFQCFPTQALSFCSRLMVHRDHRYSALAAALSIAAYQLGREQGVQFNFAHCAPRLVRLFERMGFRQYTQRFHDSEAGEQIPLVLVIEDVEHLRSTRSPFLAKALELPNNNRAGLWFASQLPTSPERNSGIKERTNDYVFDPLPLPTTAT
jgi:predicted GNAT family N-acyltransferase